jgi:hypothetical protein
MDEFRLFRSFACNDEVRGIFTFMLSNGIGKRWLVVYVLDYISMRGYNQSEAFAIWP